MRTMIEGKCDICNGDICPAKTQAQFNRNKGLHKRQKHGVVSPHNNRNGAEIDLDTRMTRVQVQQLTAEQKAERNRLRKNRWAQNKRARLEQEPQQATPASEAQPCKLSECPCCGTRFYMIKGS